MEIKRLKQDFLRKMKVGYTREYLSDQEMEEVKERLKNTPEALEKPFLEDYGIEYDTKEKRYFKRRYNSLSDEELDLIIRLDRNKTLDQILRYCKFGLYVLIFIAIMLFLAMMS